MLCNADAWSGLDVGDMASLYDDQSTAVLDLLRIWTVTC
jgi:hypothetical protein